MHFEYGTYDLNWVQGFFDHARERGIDEIGISEHSHGFREFKDLYYDELILDETPVGQYQRQWLTKNKFRYSLKDYLQFMDMLKEKGYPVKTGIEICNFKNQERVRAILQEHQFDYVIGSIHFLNGWGYDFSNIKFVWDQYDLRDIYDWYATAVEDLCASGLYDVLGHPFNIRLFKNFPDFDVQPFLERVASAIQKAGMAIDINTGTLYRYPVMEISPYPAFMETARKYQIPIILSSDAHQPEDCGRHIDLAEEYVRKFGYEDVLVFAKRKAMSVKLG
jgi:histidinol-phosphatase (PHP family)